LLKPVYVQLKVSILILSIRNLSMTWRWECRLFWNYTALI